MRTIKEVSDLTGISVRMLHYYDKIDLLKPSKLTDKGYRLYDTGALLTLQQILFFKELDLSLKEIKEIISTPNFDKKQALINQQKLLTLKRDRLNDLIELVNKILKGEKTMSFEKFDMTKYFNALEELKKEHLKEIISGFGSIEKYVEGMKKNFNSEVFSLSEEFANFKKAFLEDSHPKLKELYKKLTADLSKNPTSKEINQLAEEITKIVKEDYRLFKMYYGDDHWYSMVQLFLLFPDWINKVDEKYGNGASKFIGKALKNCLGSKQPELKTLNEKLTADLNKDPASKEIQEIVKKIVEETQKEHETFNICVGENYWEYTSELYLTNTTMIKANDMKYGKNASKYMGKALKIYCENRLT
ncbi:MerR family transcriptional regulator [Clostridium felsineum]|uniref:MerR family transcriptional regulator n=1 Tax=Clostridium felsineum TaxID=36839 RepID=UPI00214D669E|nr:MerR family transcriptional regulator [Clostridium felsineum]MCR3758617.1 MerR family transcriptional regulator [Clostridium felsineum]